MAKIKTVPHNDEAEQSVLGAILIDKDAILAVAETLKPENFYNDINGIIFGCMLSLYEERKPIDLLTLTTQLKKKKVFDKLERGYLAGLVDMVPTATNVGEYAKIVKETSLKRSL